MKRRLRLYAPDAAGRACLKAPLSLPSGWLRPFLRLAFWMLMLACAILPGLALAQAPLRGHGGPVRALLLGPDARELVSGSFDTSVIVWDLAQNRAKRVLRFHEGAVNAVARTSDGCFASAGEDRRIAVWCGTSDVPVRIFQAHDGPITALVSMTQGQAIVSAGLDGAVKIWANGESRLLHGFSAAVTALAISADGRSIVAGSADGSLRLIPVSGTGAAKEMSIAPSVSALAVAATGEVIAASSDGHLRFLSASLEVQSEVELGDQPLSSLAISPDGRLIAAAGLRGGLMILERQSRAVRFRLNGPGLPVWSLTFDADSRTLLTGDSDRMIRRWDAVAGVPLSTTVPQGEVLALPNERGAAVFRACQACHTLRAADGPRAGPTLAGIMGRRIATAPGYAYSDALRGMSIEWSEETIARLFEIGPAAYTPGTKMPEQTIDDPADRKALVEWLAKVTKD